VNLTGGSRGLGDRQLHGNEDAVTVKLPYPPDLSRWTDQHYGAGGDEIRRAIRGRVASFALVGGKIRCPTPTGSVGIVMLIGSSIRPEG
jgi:hypothetical protein